MESGYTSDYTSDMTSITSSNYIHTHRGTRRYVYSPHKPTSCLQCGCSRECILMCARHHGIVQNPYPLPNDIEEQVRLDEQHFAMSYVFGGNILVKLHRPTRILDVGTGSGTSPLFRYTLYILCISAFINEQDAGRLRSRMIIPGRRSLGWTFHPCNPLKFHQTANSLSGI